MAKFNIAITDPKSLGLTNDGKKIEATVELEARTSMNGDFLIFDHIDMDIVVSPTKGKVTTFPKAVHGDHAYESQNSLFEYLTKRGIIERDSVVAGNVYGAIEGIIVTPVDESIDPVQMTIYAVSRYIEKERPYFMFPHDYDEYLEKDMTDPPADESTALGTVPEKPRKGTMTPYARPYGLMWKMYENIQIIEEE